MQGLGIELGTLSTRKFVLFKFCPIKNGAGVVTLHVHWKREKGSQQLDTPLTTCLPQLAGFRPSL